MPELDEAEDVEADVVFLETSSSSSSTDGFIRRRISSSFLMENQCQT